MDVWKYYEYMRRLIGLTGDRRIEVTVTMELSLLLLQSRADISHLRQDFEVQGMIGIGLSAMMSQ